MSLSRVRIVMVETTHPGNIGAAARAMKNMGLTRLHLVAPRQFPNAEASARASGADDVLAAARVFDHLDDALAGCALVFGASARLRALPWPVVEPRECARLALETAASDQEVALVFGREHSGLTNEELQRCNYLMHIPTNPDYSSLNVAAAIQVAAYELFQHSGAHSIEVEDAEYATHDEMEGFYTHLERTLVATEFLDPDNPRQVLRRLRRLFNRARPEKVEVNILRGILTAVEKARS